jgi:hypothetical protein
LTGPRLSPANKGFGAGVRVSGADGLLRFNPPKRSSPPFPAEPVDVLRTLGVTTVDWLIVYIKANGGA